MLRLSGVMEKNSSYILALCFTSAAMAAIEVMLNSQGEVVSDATQTLWGLSWVLMTVFWVLADAKTQRFEKPFEFGFLIYLSWPVSLPYYLISTRGLEGFVLYVGFLGLWAGPWLAGGGGLCLSLLSLISFDVSAEGFYAAFHPSKTLAIIYRAAG